MFFSTVMALPNGVARCHGNAATLGNDGTKLLTTLRIVAVSRHNILEKAIYHQLIKVGNERKVKKKRKALMLKNRRAAPIRCRPSFAR